MAISAGRFELDALTEDHHLGARAPGFAPSTLEALRGEAGTGREVRLVLEAAGAELTGRVLDDAGEPVAGARVVVGEERLALDVRRPDGSLAAAELVVGAGADRRRLLAARSATLELVDRP